MCGRAQKAQATPRGLRLDTVSGLPFQTFHELAHAARCELVHCALETVRTDSWIMLSRV